MEGSLPMNHRAKLHEKRNVLFRQYENVYGSFTRLNTDFSIFIRVKGTRADTGKRQVIVAMPADEVWTHYVVLWLHGSYIEVIWLWQKCTKRYHTKEQSGQPLGQASKCCAYISSDI